MPRSPALFELTQELLVLGREGMQSQSRSGRLLPSAFTTGARPLHSSYRGRFVSVPSRRSWGPFLTGELLHCRVLLRG